MWLIILWAIGFIVGICITVPFLIQRDLDEKYIGVGILLVLCPIINILYPIYIIVKYIRVDFKKFL